MNESVGRDIKVGLHEGIYGLHKLSSQLRALHTYHIALKPIH
jgi:hypothetical protein